MKRVLLFLIVISLFSSLSAQYLVRGGNGMPFLADSKNGVDVYLLNGLSGAQISFTSSNPGTHQWYRYKDNGNNAELVPSVQNGNTSYISGTDVIKDGFGYFVGLPTEALPHYVWIIDYSLHRPDFLNLVATEEEDKCTFLNISANVKADALTYYLPTGFQETLTRTFHLLYDTQVWIEENRQFIFETDTITTGLPASTGLNPFTITIPAPLTDTYFTLTGDQFAEHFDTQQAIRSDEYRAIAVEAHCTVETDKESADNEIHHAGDVLGGSAPIEYTFTAYANEPVAAHYIWKISLQDSIGGLTPKLHYPDKILRYNFEENGNYLVELEVSDVQSICADTAQVFNIVIDNTVVKIPNAFSPGSSIGVNDELKIAFTSVISFRASVYNRWGNLLFQWSDPSKGWDGRVNGKFVPTGAYYVIVEYKDSTGKSRTASRAVNVLRAKN